MFAAVLLPDFRLQAALRWRENRGAVAVEEGGQLVELNAAARARGVTLGMSVPQAMAREGRIRIFLPDPEREACLEALLLDQVFLLSPDVEATAPGVATVDLCRAAPETCWQRLSDEVLARFRSLELRAQVGVAETPDLARLAAEGARPSAIIYQAAAFVSALPLAALQPSAALGSQLQDWGLHTVGDLLRLPKAEVIQRLGAEAEALMAKVSGRHKRPLRRVRTPPEYSATFSFEHEVTGTEPLLFLLRRFLEELSGRLREGHRVAREMCLKIPLDGGGAHERSFVIPEPTASVETLFGILHTHLETLRLSQCPTGLSLDLAATTSSRDQLQLFDRALRDPGQFGETLARLKALLGNECVGIPVCEDTHQPDRFTLRGMFEKCSGGGVSRPEPASYGLPLRRYRPALPGRVEMVSGHPGVIRFPSLTGAVRRWAGPFRISGAWWEASSWAVEEWDVGLEQGLYRLARRGRQWTLEGCYDEE